VIGRCNGCGGRHPHFVSPVFWHASLAEGLDAARESQRAVLVVVGRQSCGGSRALVEKTIAKEEIHGIRRRAYVCVAGDATRRTRRRRAGGPHGAATIEHPLCPNLSAEGALMH
jgi:hypothetical protein